MAGGNTNDEEPSAPPDETVEQRLTRNFNELLQELRVTQTGVQILTGFLLTVPFSQRFPSLESYEHVGYLVVLSGAVVATGLLVTPVALHRALFRQGERRWLVDAASRCASLGLAVLALTISGVVWLVFDLTIDGTAGVVAGIVSLAFLTVLWAMLPMVRRRAQ